MPDPLTGMTFAGDLRSALAPFLQGGIGTSPFLDAAMNAYNARTLPILQQQAQLMGHGQSPALLQSIAAGQAQALPSFIQTDLDNRLRAAGLLPAGAQMTQGEEQLNQSAAGLAASIANQEQMRALQAYQTGGQLLLGTAQPFGAAMTGQQQQQQNVLQAGGAAGQLQQDTVQSMLDSQQADFLRRQGLAEQSTVGLFGGQVIPSRLQGTSRTRSSK